MAARLFVQPETIAFKAGVVSSGAKANFYITGTSTRQDTYTDFALGTPHANPVVSAANGVFAEIYLDTSLNYTVDITDPLKPPLP